MSSAKGVGLNILVNIKKIACIEKNELVLIFIYTIVSSFLYLVIPVAAQGLVTFVSFGQITQPLFILGACVLIALISAATANLLQIYLVENIQQRLFAKTALAFAKNIPKLIIDIFDNYRGTELTNRYFDIFVAQKSLAELLLSGIAFLLQTVLGMLLLAFYHPYFVVFDALLLASFIFCIFLPLKNGLDTSISESSAKYKVAAWLEEMSRIPMLFKFNNNDRVGFKLADDKIYNYLFFRQKHFKQIFKHAIGGYAIQSLSITSLLLLGGILVIKNQLTLGQLVAAEVIVASIGQAAQKLSKNLENFYDLYAASDKLNFLLDLPVESSNGIAKKEPFVLSKPVSLVVDNISFLNERRKPILEDISFKIKAKDKLVIYADIGKGKTLLCRILTGIINYDSGSILYDNVNIKNIDIKDLRGSISYINNIEFFDGTLYENMVMSNDNITIQEVSDAINKFNLEGVISKLENGLFTVVNDNHHSLSDSDLLILMFVRAYLSKPAFIIIDNVLDYMPDGNKQMIIDFLKNDFFNTTILITTNQKNLLTHFENIVNL